MKNAILLLSAVCLMFPTFANEHSTSGKIKEVTVFIQGAQVSRTVNFQLEKGSATYVVHGLSPQVDESSIRVGGKGDFTLLSVSKRTNYLSATPKPKAMVLLEDSLELLITQANSLAAQEFGLNEEKNLILNNKEVKGEDQNLSAEELAAMSSFFRERLTAISNELYAISRAKNEVKQQQDKLHKQLNEYVSKRNKPMTEVVLEMLSKNGGSAQLELIYQVSDAGWAPSYDLRTSGKSTRLDVTSYASVFQGTGVDWDDVKLTLSTNYPQRGNQKPQLHPWVLRFVQTYYVDGMSNRRTGYASPKAADVALEEVSSQAYGSTAADFTQVTRNTLNVEYKIDLAYSIASTRKDHKVQIRSTSLPAKLRYYVAPKLDKTAFLVAGVSNWENEGLLPGESRQFVDDTYMGKGFLNTQTTKDTLLVSMGRDQEIVAERKRIKDYAQKAFIGGSKTETIGIEIRVRNTKNVPVELRIEDQYPISSDEAIEITLAESSNASINAETGLLHWDLNLAPGASKTLRFVYKVKYPKDQVINL